MSGQARQMASQVLNTTIMQKIGMNTNNIFVQYFISLIAISVLTFFTTRVPQYQQRFQIWLATYFTPLKPTIKFTFSKFRHSSNLNGANNAILAWLEHIKKSISEFDDQHKDSIKGIKAVASRTQFNKIKKIYESRTDWIPDQIKPFLIENDIWVQLGKNTLKSESGEQYSLDEYILSIFTTTKDVIYLMDYHDKLVEKFEKKLKSKYEQNPHIFTFDEFDEKTKELKWVNYAFSSSRTLDHVWFPEKETFLEAYNTFLFKKEEYDERGDPYTFSILLYGPPGCGKTSILKSLINYDLKKRNKTSHLFVVPFSKVDSVEIFEKIMLDKKVNGIEINMENRIYVFEDFDANDQASVFNIRKSLKGVDDVNFKEKKKKSGESATESKEEKKEDLIPSKIEDSKKKEKKVEGPQDKMGSMLVSLLESVDDLDKDNSKLNLSDILNTLDGICERTGQRCIWTTNKSPPQKHFDPAFLRPGRMDMIIKLGRCDRNGMKYLIENYFDDCKVDMNDLMNIDEGRFTPAQLKQLCKEGGSYELALKMMKEICNPGIKFENKDGSGKVKIPKLIRTLSEPTSGKHVRKLHSGHWFKDDEIEKDSVIVVN